MNMESWTVKLVFGTGKPDHQCRHGMPLPGTFEHFISKGKIVDSPAIRSEGSSTWSFVCHLLWLCCGIKHQVDCEPI